MRVRSTYPARLFSECKTLSFCACVDLMFARLGRYFPILKFLDPQTLYILVKSNNENLLVLYLYSGSNEARR